MVAIVDEEYRKFRREMTAGGVYQIESVNRAKSLTVQRFLVIPASVRG